MRKDDCFLLGYVIKPHGLKGELILHLDADDPHYYETLESVFLEIQGRLVPFFIRTLAIQGEKAIVAFDETQSLEDAREICGAAIYLPDALLPPLGKDQFYFHQIIGYELRDISLGNVGPITNIYDSGKQHLFAVDYQKREILVPMIDELICKVDHEARTIEVALPDGLLDIYLEE